MPRAKINTVPTTADKHATFDDIVVDANPTIKDIACRARALLAEVMPGITEVPWPRQRIAGYGVGPKKLSQHFCYIAPHTAHVNLGFSYGADLDDPAGLLQGQGKSLRHIKLTRAADLEQPALRDLVVRASRHLPRLK